MPIKDDDRRREYYREYRPKRRAGQPAGERNRQDRARRAEQRKAEREAAPAPDTPILWPHQQAL